MTMPTKMNCPHQGDGWCLKCVATLETAVTQLRSALISAKTDIAHWVAFAERQLVEIPDADYVPCMPSAGGIKESKRIMAEITKALGGKVE